MTTWITVNLPWSRDFEPPDPPFTEEMRAWCGGKTYGELYEEYHQKTLLVYAKEGLKLFGPLSPEGVALVEEYDRITSELFERIEDTPERVAYEAHCERLREEHELTYFKNKLKVGMLIEFADGRRLLVGDMNQYATLAGCCPEDISDDAIVVRFCMLEMPT